MNNSTCTVNMDTVYVVTDKNNYHPIVFRLENDIRNYLLEQFIYHIKYSDNNNDKDKDNLTFSDFKEEYIIKSFMLDLNKTYYLIQNSNFKSVGDIITDNIEVWKSQVTNNSDTYLEICKVSF